MALEFSIYEATQLEELGTLTSLAGPKGRLRFTIKSLQSTGLLCVVVTKADGTSDTVTCSKAVTTAVRKALAAGTIPKQCLGAIANLMVLEGTNGGNYISAPASAAGVEEFTIDELKKVTISYEELVAF